jgi:SAM-dependent methyltransferase
LGSFPPANFLSQFPNDDSESLPLTLLSCSDCGHLQQGFFFPPEKLFSNYLYQSGTSKTLDDFFIEISDLAAESLPSGAKILELACNDGTFLEKVNARGFSVLGIDPAENIVKIANAKGLEVIHGFWPMDLKKKFDAIYAFNVLAHVTDPINFFRAALAQLNEEGVIVIQTSQIFMIENSEFDTIYHEHYSFFTKASLNYLAFKFNLNLSIFETTVHGGSALAIFTKKNSSSKIISSLRGAIGKKFIKREFTDISLKHSNSQLNNFVKKCLTFKSRIDEIVNEQINFGRKIVFVGAAAKAITVLLYSKVHADFIVDEAPLKIGKYIPASDLKILDLKDINNIEENCFFIIGAWNFFDELKFKIKNLRSKNANDDKFFAYFPNERFE